MDAELYREARRIALDVYMVVVDNRGQQALDAYNLGQYERSIAASNLVSIAADATRFALEELEMDYRESQRIKIDLP